MQIRLWRIVCLFPLFFFCFAAVKAEKNDSSEIIYFYTHCPKCREIEKHILPRIPKTHKIIWAYAGNPKVMEELLALEGNKTIFPPALYWNGKLYSAQEALDDFLKDLFSPSELFPSEKQEKKTKSQNLFKSTPIKNTAVFCAGFLDGINPCAFTVFLFFLSFLSISGISALHRNLAGASFIFSIFSTYFLTGLSGFTLLASVIHLRLLSIFYDAVLILSVFIFFLSTLDLFNLRKNTALILLKMPEKWIQRTHALIRKSVQKTAHRTFFLMGISIFLGMSLGLMELVCTGQIYLPVLKILLRESNGANWTGAACSLLIYNLAFSLPLIMIQFLFHFAQRQKNLQTARSFHLFFRVLLPLLLLALILIQVSYDF